MVLWLAVRLYAFAWRAILTWVAAVTVWHVCGLRCSMEQLALATVSIVGVSLVWAHWHLED
jgi:uncharacterized protein (DUF2336 family)